MAAWVFAVCVAFLAAGVLWFYVLQPLIDAWRPVKPFTPPPTRKRVRYVVSRRARGVSEAGRNTAQIPVTKQAQPGTVPQMWQDDETGIVAITAHMSKAELITLLAVQKNADGTYAYSANRIRDFVGGTTSAVMEQIKAVRPDAKPAPQAPQPSRGKSLRRPARGW